MAQPLVSIDDYIAGFSKDVQLILGTIRETIHESVPGAGETIAYQMPTITFDGRSLVHFAAWKKHIGLYPLPEVDDDLERELLPYATGKGTANFPLDRPIPYALIGRIVTRLLEQRGQ